MNPNFAPAVSSQKRQINVSDHCVAPLHCFSLASVRAARQTDGEDIGRALDMFLPKRKSFRLLILVCFLGLAAGGLIGLYQARIIFPDRPLAVEQVDRLYGDALRPGMSWNEVKAWLTSQSISELPRSSRGHPPQGPPTFDILHREKATFPGWWMDVRGHRAVAEWAGLSIDDVFWLVRYDASSFWVSPRTITVYLFFDAEDKLLKHWVDEFVYSL